MEREYKVILDGDKTNPFYFTVTDPDPGDEIEQEHINKNEKMLCCVELEEDDWYPANTNWVKAIRDLFQKDGPYGNSSCGTRVYIERIN